MNETKVAKTFSNFFWKCCQQTRHKRDDAKFKDQPVLSTNSVNIAIQKFDDHASAKLIRDNKMP